MSGPIVRSGASAKFSQNWDRIFSTEPAKKSKGKSAGKAAASTGKAVTNATKPKADKPKAKAKAAATKASAKGKK